MESSPFAAPDLAAVNQPDVAELLKDVPGGALNRNGSVTGIAQYRGLFGDRVNVLVDGVNMVGAGPNAMDTPLSHLSRQQLASLQVIRGIAPVSSGVETLGGSIITNSRGGDFGESGVFRSQLQGGLAAAQVNESAAASLMAAYANNTHKLFADASLEKGDDSEFPGGEVRPTGFDRARYALGYGYRRESNELMLKLASHRTGASGTPSLPMDIRYADSDVARLGYHWTMAEQQWNLQLSHSRNDHVMTNFDLRPRMMGMPTRLATAEASGSSLRIDTALAALGGELQLGLDAQLAKHDTVITDPNNPMFKVDNFNDVERNLFSGFAEWQGGIGGGWNAEIGLRVTQTQMDAGQVASSMAAMMPPVKMLVDRFNQADRSQDDTNFDWVLQFDHKLGSHSQLIAGLARKTRAPSYQERYLWLPLESTGGLADGNRYVGNINLDSEVSHQLELGLDWHQGQIWAAPRLFYREVSDYIQGTPATDATVIMVSTNNGDATPLQFNNVDATLYGADLSYGANLATQWRLNGVLSYVRGERDDISDNLYRIYPLNGSLGLTYHRDSWSVTAQSQFAAGQDKLSATNDEQATSGYAVYNLFGHYDLNDKLSLQGGVSNLFDREYAEHTAGINRVMGSDVPMRSRVPNAGRGVYAGLKFSL